MPTATLDAPAAPAASFTYQKRPCGACSGGAHDHCPVAVWNPGSGRILVPATGGLPAKYAGEALYCPCETCDGKTPRCRECGYQWGPVDGLSERLVCRDRAECVLRIEARLADDPLHQLILECQRTRIVAGEVVDRPRRATPQEVAARRAAKAAAVARGCVCGCGGTTKGGAFLPGHDARFVSILIGRLNDAPKRQAAGVDKANRAALTEFPKLLGKYEKRIASVA